MSKNTKEIIIGTVLAGLLLGLGSWIKDTESRVEAIDVRAVEKDKAVQKQLTDLKDYLGQRLDRIETKLDSK